MDNIEIKENENVVKTTKGRNTCLNFFEALACIFIMLHLGHAPFPGEFGKIVACIGNFAVPLFFVVSGYYLIKPNTTKDELRNKLKVRIKKMLFLLLFSFVIYTIISFIKKDFGEEVLTTSEWFKEHFLSLKRWAKFLLFNFPLVEPINWYMLASIYCYIIIYIFADIFLNKKWIINVLVGSMPIWIIYGLCINKFNPSLFGFELSSLESLPRTWFAEGLPFISLGILLKRYEDKLKSINLKYYIIVLIASLLLKIAELYLFEYLFNGSVRYTLGTIIETICLIEISMIVPTFMSKSKMLNQKGNWTMFVYVFQFAVIYVVKFVYVKLGIEENIIASWFRPIIVILFTVMIAMIFNRLYVFLLDYKKNKEYNDIK